MSRQTLRIEATVSPTGTLALADLPPGQDVEVIVSVRPLGVSDKPLGTPTYPLRGLPVEYLDPTEPVAAEDWEAAQ